MTIKTDFQKIQQSNKLDFLDIAGFEHKQLQAWDYLLDPKYKYLLYGGAACFTADTLVLTEGGYVEISKVQIGTKVYSLRENKVELSKVTNTFVYGGNKRQEMIRLIVDGETITCTPEHRFYVDGNWVSISVLYERILEICGGGKQQLSNLKSRSFTHKELEKYRTGLNSERDKKEIQTQSGNTRNVRQDVWCECYNYKRYYSTKELEARELDIREIDSIEYITTDDSVYDLEVENVNYIVSKKNIVVHNSGGKSYWLRWSAFGLGLYYVQKYGITNFTIGLFCEDYPTLKDRQISRIKMEFPAWFGEIADRSDYGYSFKAAEDYGGFYIVFRNLDDPSKYYSSEFIAILVDELTRNPQSTFEDLRFRLRWAGIPDPKFAAATNPGGIGHAFVKKLWITPDEANPDVEASSFIYIPATVHDNSYMDQSYIKQLESLPPQKRKALLEGSWDIFAGQVFTEWLAQRHVIEPFELPANWKRYMSMDWGVNAPTAVYWYAVDEESRVYIYREWYMNGDMFKAKYNEDMTPTRVAEKLIEINDRERPLYMVSDPACWNKPQGGESVAETMIRMGLPLIEADNDRISGLNRVRENLAVAPDGKPWIQVFKTCYNLINTLPSLVYDEHQVEDVDSNGDDHAYDSIRYFLMSRPSRTKPEPKEEPLMRQVYRAALKKYNQIQ